MICNRAWIGVYDYQNSKTYNNRHSLVVTDPTTTRSVRSLTRRELTGTRIFCVLWPYIILYALLNYIYHKTAEVPTEVIAKAPIGCYYFAFA